MTAEHAAGKIYHPLLDILQLNAQPTHVQHALFDFVLDPLYIVLGGKYRRMTAIPVKARPGLKYGNILACTDELTVKLAQVFQDRNQERQKRISLIQREMAHPGLPHQ